MTVGRSLLRIDGREKVLGRACYAADYTAEEVLYLQVKRSPHPHAQIHAVQVHKARAIEGVVDIVTAADLPTQERYGLIIKDQEVLCSQRVRYMGDALALVTAESQEVARRAVEEIQVHYTPLPVIGTPWEAAQQDAPAIHTGGNLLQHVKLRRGNVQEGFQKAAHLFTHSFQSAPLEQVPLQPEAGIAWVDDAGIVTIQAAAQWLHDLQADISRVLGLSQKQVRLIQPVIGGAFGKREDISVHIHLALMALRTRRPVKMVYSREESIITQAKRHPFFYQIKTGHDREGRILAWEGSIYGDTGSYASGGPAVVRQALFLAPGPYFIPHLKGDAYLYYTNNTYCGAMRGFGGTQSAFAYESHMDMVARKLGIDPCRIREINALGPGSITSTGQRIYTDGMLQTIKGAVLAAGWKRERKKGGACGGQERIRRGIGMATTFFGIGYGEGFPDHAHARVLLNRDGRIEIYTAGAEVGQGLHTALVQIGSTALSIPPQFIHIKGGDTANTFSAGSTSASRQTYFSGNAVLNACEDLKMRLFQQASLIFGGSIASFYIKNREIISRDNPQCRISFQDLAEEQPPFALVGEAFFFKRTTPPDPETGQGSQLYASYAFATQVAVVEVDTRTGEVCVLQVYAAHDVGRAINPRAIEGQVEGGVAMGLGMALMEEQLYRNGITLNPNLTDYVIPTTLDVPPVETIIIQEEEPTGPFGARGVGEPSTLPTAPAILNAIYDAVGVRIQRLPATPEKILRALQQKESQQDSPDQYPGATT